MQRDDEAQFLGETLTWSLDLSPRHQQNSDAELTVLLSAVDGSHVSATLLRNTTEAWVTYTGSYVAPGGQGITKLSLVSDPLTFYRVLDEDSARYRGENHIDNVRLSSQVCSEDAQHELAKTGSPLTLPLTWGIGALMLGTAIAERARARAKLSR
jgi:hypothetical protein